MPWQVLPGDEWRDYTPLWAHGAQPLVGHELLLVDSLQVERSRFSCGQVSLLSDSL